ncbi:hypothetical protein B0T25DRAFT_7861 [Lasiosphaeria hispida]|uniref:Uncharacterized protein n=1 Tax=Lasiosphaeria hispida TaxID=260671 RepID=A0AAJ0HTQ7_9PEZI|nr:hypothetical protein B0T25DRAFT_7861 [Lasiosphaeria hispida]
MTLQNRRPFLHILLCLILHVANVLGLPHLVRRDDDELPARATALNVFAALFTIITLIFLALWWIMRMLNKALRNLSATVTGSSSSDTSSVSEVAFVWTSQDRGYMVDKDRSSIVGEVRRPSGRPPPPPRNAG